MEVGLGRIKCRLRVCWSGPTELCFFLLSCCVRPFLLAAHVMLPSRTVWIGSYLLFATAGPAFPEQYKHEDGGSYRGQWRGMRKEGLGVYSYPPAEEGGTGARYEGEWRDNLKDGRGVYYFPKGGTYEGEWSGGGMNGVGVRTFSTGQVRGAAME